MVIGRIWSWARSPERFTLQAPFSRPRGGKLIGNDNTPAEPLARGLGGRRPIDRRPQMREAERACAGVGSKGGGLCGRHVRGAALERGRERRLGKKHCGAPRRAPRR
jgi:hypothetical protein